MIPVFNKKGKDDLGKRFGFLVNKMQVFLIRTVKFSLVYWKPRHGYIRTYCTRRAFNRLVSHS